MTICTNLGNIHVRTKQWLPALVYSLVKSNQTIEAVHRAKLKLAIVKLGGLMHGEVSLCAMHQIPQAIMVGQLMCNASNFLFIVVKASVANTKTHC